MSLLEINNLVTSFKTEQGDHSLDYKNLCQQSNIYAFQCLSFLAHF